MDVVCVLVLPPAEDASKKTRAVMSQMSRDLRENVAKISHEYHVIVNSIQNILNVRSKEGHVPQICEFERSLIWIVSL